MCGKCKDGHARVGDDCLPCPSNSGATIALGTLGIIVGITLVTVVVRRNVLGDPKSISGVAIKIFLNYIAVLGQLSEFSLPQPQSFA